MSAASRLIIMKLLLVAMVILVTQAKTSFSSTADRDVDKECLALGKKGMCEFFDCFEQRLTCGKKNFMEDYGRYCKRFQQKKENFTEEGKRFVQKSQRCMTQGLLKKYRRDSVDCQQLEKNAVALIKPCYVDAGLCDVFLSNRKQFLGIVDINKDLIKKVLWKEMVGLGTKCAPKLRLEFLKKALKKAATKLFAKLAEKDETTKTRKTRREEAKNHEFKVAKTTSDEDNDAMLNDGDFKMTNEYSEDNY
ncbi:hypothetical protein ACOMHN_028618 [Nucella lapillus]